MWMLPELIVIASAFLVLGADLFLLGDRKRLLLSLCLWGLALAGVSTAYLFGQEGTMLGGRFAVDALGQWFKLIFILAAFLTVSFGMEPFEPQAEKPLGSRAEFLAVLLFTLAGMMFLISSRDLVSFYVSLELSTIPLFALTAWSRTSRSGEGAFKYLGVGALASAFFLYGFGFLYGLTGSTSFVEIAHSLHGSPALWLAAVLCLAGVGFKLTLFPFHFWAPDAYDGAPTPVTAYLSVASKAAGLAIAFQIFYRLLGSFLPQMSGAVAFFATCTMTLGNLVAIRQSNLKRFMAYSAISQAGYLILGFLGGSGQDASAMVFYMLVYVLTNLAAFAVLILQIHQRGGEEMESLKGLSETNPLLAVVMMVALFGLAGIPPLSGFVGKFFLFNAAAKAGYYWLVGVAALNSTVSLYYYLRIVRQMYIEAPAAGAKPLRVSLPMALGLGVATVGSVVCGLIPQLYERIGVDAARWLWLAAK